MTSAPAIQTGESLSGSFAASARPAPARRRKRRPAPFSLRLTPEERARLQAEAGETPLATYIKFRLFNNLPGLTKPCGSAKPPHAETVLIAKLLAALGEARLANNLNQLAKHANMGTLEVSEDTENELLAACAEIHAMRRDLIAALGLKESGRR
jgi:hypothetical protein